MHETTVYFSRSYQDAVAEDRHLEDSKLLFSGPLLPHAERWYSTVTNSRGFIPYQDKEKTLPDELEPLLQECMPLYLKLFQHSVRLS